MFRAPKQTQSINVLLDDLQTRDQARIARHLGVSARTLARWRATDRAPRAALLAVFWETRYGMETADVQAFNDRHWAESLAHALERETAMLRARIAHLERLGGFGSANAPLWASA